MPSLPEGKRWELFLFLCRGTIRLFSAGASALYTPSLKRLPGAIITTHLSAELFFFVDGSHCIFFFLFTGRGQTTREVNRKHMGSPNAKPDIQKGKKVGQPPKMFYVGVPF